MELRLQTKIILICAAIFFLVTGAGTIVNGIYFNKEYSRVLESKAFVIGQTLKSQLDRLLKMHIPLNQLEGFEEMCQETLVKHDFLSYAMVVDLDGKILFHNDPDQQYRVISDTKVLKSIKSGHEGVHLITVNEKICYDFLIPVFDSQNEPIAAVRTGFPRAIIADKTKTLAIYSAGITLLSFAIGIIFIVLSLDLWVNKPVGRFIRTIQAIRQRGTSASQMVEITSNDEIGQLARAFNEMTEELQATTVSKNYMDMIVENMLNSLIIIDNEYMIQSANQETLNLLGYAEEELVGTSIDKVFVSPRQPGMFQNKDQPPVEPIKAAEAIYLSKSQKKIPVLFSCSIIQSKDGERQGYICVAQDITEIKTLRGFLPICTACKKIRDDSGYWNQVENYLAKHSTAQFSHSMCPECAQKMYGEEDWFQELELPVISEKDDDTDG